MGPPIPPLMALPVPRSRPMGPMTKRTQFSQQLPDDLLSAARRQSPQCLEKYWAANGRRQTALALQCWPDRRDSDRRVEGAEDYKAFEAAITADYDPRSAVERELVLRLASLLWLGAPLHCDGNRLIRNPG